MPVAFDAENHQLPSNFASRWDQRERERETKSASFSMKNHGVLGLKTLLVQLYGCCDWLTG